MRPLAPEGGAAARCPARRAARRRPRSAASGPGRIRLPGPGLPGQGGSPPWLRAGVQERRPGPKRPP